MRRLVLLAAGAAFALGAGAASAQFADPRTAAGAAGQIAGKPAPDIDTPAKIDPSRDPAREGAPAAPTPLPQAVLPDEAATASPADDRSAEAEAGKAPQPDAPAADRPAPPRSTPYLAPKR